MRWSGFQALTNAVFSPTPYTLHPTPFFMTLTRQELYIPATLLCDPYYIQFSEHARSRRFSTRRQGRSLRIQNSCIIDPHKEI
ncbi:hypothetical protein [Nostoc sp.]|uniref:hypothetical protein n=1 Tax=Nostoc sp. TaxID=1180 RepID=UPI002FF66548